MAIGELCVGSVPKQRAHRRQVHVPPVAVTPIKIGKITSRKSRPRFRCALLSLAFLGFLVVFSTGFIATAPAAQALCTNSNPSADLPYQSVAGIFISAPNPAPVVQPSSNQIHFGASFPQPTFEHYGLGGLRFNSDPTCSGNDSSAGVGGTVGNFLMLFPKFGMAANFAVLHAALNPDEFLNIFTGFFADVNGLVKDSFLGHLQETLFKPLVPAVIAVLGAFLLARATRQRVSESVSAVVWVVFIMLIGAALFSWPLKAIDGAKAVLGATTQTVSNAVGLGDNPSAAATESLYKTFLYDPWAMGTFGDSRSISAQKYGPPLFYSRAVQWGEIKDYQQNNDKLVEKKNDLSIQTLSDLKETDSITYGVFKDNGPYISAAFLSILGTVAIVPFTLVAGLLLIATYIIIVLALLVAPAVLAVGAFYPMRAIVRTGAHIISGALINSIIFFTCSLIVIRLDQTILDPETNFQGLIRYLLVALVTVIVWKVTRPIRSFSKMVSYPYREATIRNEGLITAGAVQGDGERPAIGKARAGNKTKRPLLQRSHRSNGPGSMAKQGKSKGPLGNRSMIRAEAQPQSLSRPVVAKVDGKRVKADLLDKQGKVLGVGLNSSTHPAGKGAPKPANNRASTSGANAQPWSNKRSAAVSSDSEEGIFMPPKAGPNKPNHSPTKRSVIDLQPESVTDSQLPSSLPTPAKTAETP